MSKEIVSKTNITSIVFVGAGRRSGCSAIAGAFEEALRPRLAPALPLGVSESVTSCVLTPSTIFDDGSSDLLIPYYLQVAKNTIVVLVRGDGMMNDISKNKEKGTVVTVFRCDPPENARAVAFNCNTIDIPFTEKVEDIDVTLLVDRCIAILKEHSE